VLQIEMKDGSKHSIWFSNVAVRSEVLSRFDRGDFVEAATLVPDRALRLHHVVLGFIGSAAVIAFMLGSTSEPYVRTPDGPIVWGIVIFVAAMPLLSLARWLGLARDQLNKFDRF
jgi:hypothetical protein